MARAILLAGLLATALWAAPQDSLKAVEKATVLIRLKTRVYASNVRYSTFGTGFCMNATGLIATCWHVVEPMGIDGLGSLEPRQTVSLAVRYQGKDYDARIVAVDEKRDLALLCISSATPSFLKPAPPLSGAEVQVRALGYPNAATRPVLQQTRGKLVKRGKTYDLMMALTHGNSGGPVVDLQGRLVCVAKALDPANGRVDYSSAEEVMALAKGLGDRIPEKVSAKFVSIPAGADVFLDGARQGTTPLKITVPVGRQQLFVRKNGRVWLQDICPKADETFIAPLRVVRVLDLSGKASQNQVPKKSQAEGDPHAFPKMARMAGAWRISDERVEALGALPSVQSCMGDEPMPASYSFGADLRFSGASKDARAGLLFQASSHGYYCFRILRRENRAQLAWHNYSPFGWITLAEHPIEKPKAMHRLSVFYYGGQIQCGLDGEIVLGHRGPLSEKGSVGFYAINSPATFTRITLRKLVERDLGLKSTTSYGRFWFYDRFDRASTGWSGPVPWLMTRGGGVVASKHPAQTLHRQVHLQDFRADLVLRMGTGNGVFGFIFGHRNDGERDCGYRLLLGEKAQRLRLLRYRGGREEQLASQPFKSAQLLADRDGHLLFGAPVSRLQLDVNGKSVRLFTPVGDLMRMTLPEPAEAGSFGIYTQGCEFVLQGLMLSSHDGEAPK